MWRDRDRYPEHNLVPDTFWLVIAVLLFAACGLVWLIGQVAAIVFAPHHQHLPVRLVDMLGVLLACPAPGTTPPKPGHPLSSRYCPARWDVRRRRAHLLAPSPPLWTAGAAGVSPGSPPSAGAWREVGELVAAAPAPGRGAAAGADHPGPPRPNPRPPPGSALSGRRAVPLGARLRPTRLLQDPRARDPRDPGVAGQPRHDVD
jgi:hypothetical protein